VTFLSPVGDVPTLTYTNPAGQFQLFYFIFIVIFIFLIFFVYKYNGYVPAQGVVEGIMFDESARRVPRYEGEPKVGSPPMLNDFQPKTALELKEIFKGKNLIQIEKLLNADFAKDIFEEIYPEEKYPILYKGGGGIVISGERPDSIAVDYNP
jgi:hypothetical protein